MKFWREVDGLLLRQAANHADKLQQAISASVDASTITDDFLRAHPIGQRITPNDARAWARLHIRPNTAYLQAVLRRLYADAWVLGQDVALSAYARAALGVNKAPTANDINVAINTNWDNWSPGNRGAAALVSPPKGLRDLLERNVSKPATIDGMTNTLLDRIGTRLADGLNVGATASTTARALLTDEKIGAAIRENVNVAINDSARALMIATTEYSRAFNVSNVDNYGELGVEQVEWLALDPCDLCADNDGVVVTLGEAFPSEDTEPPAHPNCRCTILPVVDGGLPDAITAGEDVAPVVEQPLMHDGADVLAVDTHPDLAVTTITPDMADVAQTATLFADAWNMEYNDYNEAIRDAYATQTFGGYKAVANAAIEGRTLFVSGSFEKADGTTVGDFERHFWRDDKENLFVKNDQLIIKPEYRGQGIGSEFSKFSEDLYRANGIKEIWLDAGFEDGAYTWAKAGYEFRTQPKLLIEHLKEQLPDIPKTFPNHPELVTSVQSIINRLETMDIGDPNYPLPAELANLRAGDPADTWFAKWLLENASFRGIKRL